MLANFFVGHGASNAVDAERCGLLAAPGKEKAGDFSGGGGGQGKQPQLLADVQEFLIELLMDALAGAGIALEEVEKEHGGERGQQTRSLSHGGDACRSAAERGTESKKVTGAGGAEGKAAAFGGVKKKAHLPSLQKQD